MNSPTLSPPAWRSPAWLPTLQQAEPAEARRLMRTAALELLRWQIDAAGAALPRFDDQAQRRELQLFVDACVVGEFGRQWTPTQADWWQRCVQALERNHAEQSLLPMLPVLGIDGAAPQPMMGPLSYELAALLRAPGLAWDEEDELDWAIRYWEQARKAELAVGDDFGEFWRRLEWTGLQRHLALLGAFCRARQAGAASEAAEALPRLFAYAIKVSTRYIELAPLTRLLQDLQGGLVQTGFSLR